MGVIAKVTSFTGGFTGNPTDCSHGAETKIKAKKNSHSRSLSLTVNEP